MHDPRARTWTGRHCEGCVVARGLSLLLRLRHHYFILCSMRFGLDFAQCVCVCVYFVFVRAERALLRRRARISALCSSVHRTITKGPSESTAHSHAQYLCYVCVCVMIIYTLTSFVFGAHARGVVIRMYVLCERGMRAVFVFVCSQFTEVVGLHLKKKPDLTGVQHWGNI